MKLNDFELENYLFEIKEEDLTRDEKCDIIQKLEKEMAEIFYGMDISNQ